MLEVARDLFVAQGFSRTPIAQIAREAGVSAPTVFAGFRTKVNLLKQVVDTAITGDEEQVPLAARPIMRRVHEAATFPELVERLADAFVEVASRAAPVARVAYAAAGRLGVSSPGERDRLRDTIWTLNSFQQWDLLVRQRGWSPAAYREWMVTSLTALLPAREH